MCIRDSVDGHLARVGTQDAGQNAHKRRFAGAVRADQPEHAAVAHFGADVAHRRKAVEAFRNIRCTNHIVRFLSLALRALRAVPELRKQLAHLGGGQRKQLPVMRGLRQRGLQLFTQRVQRAGRDVYKRQDRFRRHSTGR